MFKAKHNICCIFRRRNKCHFSLEHFNKSTIPSTFLVTARRTKTWSTFLLTCLLLMFGVRTNYLHSFIQSELGEKLRAWRWWTEHIKPCAAGLEPARGCSLNFCPLLLTTTSVTALFTSVKNSSHPQLGAVSHLLRMAGWKNA